MSHTAVCGGLRGTAGEAPSNPTVLGAAPQILAMARCEGQSQTDLTSADVHRENCRSGDEVIAVSSKVLILQELDVITISIITWGGGAGAVSLQRRAMHGGTGQTRVIPAELECVVHGCVQAQRHPPASPPWLDSCDVS